MNKPNLFNELRADLPPFMIDPFMTPLFFELPSLRQRKEDIPLLIDHFMTLHGGVETSASRIQMDRFLDHDWPGNVRKLQNVVH